MTKKKVVTEIKISLEIFYIKTEKRLSQGRKEQSRQIKKRRVIKKPHNTYHDTESIDLSE